MKNIGLICSALVSASFLMFLIGCSAVQIPPGTTFNDSVPRWSWTGVWRGSGGSVIKIEQNGDRWIASGQAGGVATIIGNRAVGYATDGVPRSFEFVLSDDGMYAKGTVTASGIPLSSALERISGPPIPLDNAVSIASARPEISFPSQLEAVKPIATGNERRIALVIGNGAYGKGMNLVNPINDAVDISQELQNLNFKVKLLKNASRRDMENAIREFGGELSSGDIGLLYYAGHGVQIEGENFLIPTDASMQSSADVKYQSVPMNWVLETMRETKNSMNVIVFDACRNNPFPQSQRGGARGLAVAPKVRGALVAYSTSPDDVASDGNGRNSPYASALLRYMKTPGQPIEQMFKQVRIAVETETRGRQTPWELSSLVGDFYFAR